MAKFDINRNGYDTEQVDAFIDKLTLRYEEKLSEQKDKLYTLKNQVTMLENRLESYTEKDKQISKALIYAVEKAEKIEANANHLYDLEIQRVRLLYAEWQNIVSMLMGEGVDSATLKKIKAFNKAVTDIVESSEAREKKSIKSDIKKNSDNYIKNLLNQMDYVINKKDDRVAQKQAQNRLIDVHAKESARVTNVKQKNMAIKSKMEDYLSSEEETQTAYSKNIVRSKYRSRGGSVAVYEPNESGFDIQEALNVKDDLSVVMQGFDFYDEIEKNSKKK